MSTPRTSVSKSPRRTAKQSGTSATSAPKSSRRTTKKDVPTPESPAMEQPNGNVCQAPVTTNRDPAIRAREQVRILALVTDPFRMQILTILSKGETSVVELANRIGVAPLVLSRQLAILRIGHMIESRRDGKSYRYTLTQAGRSLAKLIAQIEV